jgi:cyclopropane fatty-acyl-phospholipid synthase-like methyltransferase
MDALDPESLARQLRSPHGSEARSVGDFMSKGNRNLYELLFRALGREPFKSILEAGCGNGWFIPHLFHLFPGIRYQGAELSREMAEASLERITGTGLSSVAQVMHADIQAIEPSPDFDRVIALNLLYFFPEPLQLIRHLTAFLKPGGRLLIAIRTGSSMRQLPFTRHGFSLYEPEEVRFHFEAAGLRDIRIVLEEEQLTTPSGTYPLVNTVLEGALP